LATRSHAAGIASLETRARVARLALWAFIAVTAGNILALLVYLARQMQWADPPLVIEEFAVVLGMLFWVFFFIAAVPIVLWVYRAHANLRDGGVDALEYSPGWATGSYFVPFANCVVPFQAMRELFNRSHGEPADFARSSAEPVTSWWACHIPAVFLTLILGLMAAMPLVSNVWFTAPPAATTGMGVFNYLLFLGSAWFLKQIIGAITNAQAHGVVTASVFE